MALACVSMANAQKYGFSIELGQHYGINKVKAEDLPFNAPLKYSSGSGTGRQLMFHIFPDSSNWFLSFGLGQMQGNPVLAASRDLRGPGNYEAVTRSVSVLRFIPRVSYLYGEGRFDMTFSAGLLLPMVSRTKEVYSRRDSAADIKTTSVLRQYPSIGFNGSIGLGVKVTPRIRFFLNTDINILNHQVKSRTVTGYEHSGGKTLQEAYPDKASQEVLYRRDVTDVRNNRDVLPQRFNKDQPTDKLAYRVSDSSIGLHAGFLFLF
jgi:hypothetical protein